MTRLHFATDGSRGRPVLVFSGSLGSTVTMWEPQVAAFANDHYVIRYDHPGHGRSPLPEEGANVDGFADAVVELLDELEIARASFCGLSLGGAVGMSLALRAPDRLERLVLCCTAARIATPDFWADRAATVRREGLEVIADIVLSRWFTAAFAAEQPEVIRRHRDMLVSTPAEGYARRCEVLAAANFRDRLEDIPTRTLVVTASEDPVIPRADMEELARRIPDAGHVVIDGAAHIVNVEQADPFNRALQG